MEFLQGCIIKIAINCTGVGWLHRTILKKRFEKNWVSTSRCFLDHFHGKTVLSDENVKISNEQNLYQIWIFKMDERNPKLKCLK